jgi:hypothetical protein
MIIRWLKPGVFFCTLFVFLFLIDDVHARQQPAGHPAKPVKQAEQLFTFRIIPALHDTWGYDVFSGERLLIHQPAIPGIAGNDGFTTSARAQKVAALVIKKLKQGIMPPAVTIAEMKALHAI